MRAGPAGRVPSLSDSRKVRVLAWAAVAGVVALPLLAEGVVRLRAYLKYGAVTDIYEIFEPHPDVDLLRPRAGLDVTIGGTSHIRISAQGFRSPEVEVPRPPRTVRLAFLGGSTTFCAQASSNERTWPHLLVERLGAARPDVRFEHLNAGVTGYSVEDSTRAVAARLAAVDPDVIVITHAAKDLAADARALALPRGLVDEPEEGWLERSSVLWMLVKKNLWYQRSLARGADPSGKLDYDPTAVSGAFRDRLRALVSAARGEAEVVALVTFPILLREGQPPDEQLAHAAQAFTFTPYLTPDAIRAGYREYNRVIREVARETGAVLVDDVDRIPGDREHFHDTVHFTERGYEVQATRVAEALLAADAFVAHVDRAAEGS